MKCFCVRFIVIGVFYLIFFFLCDCSGKVIAAFLESSDSKINQLANKELKKLIDGGVLKVPEPKVVTGKKE